MARSWPLRWSDMVRLCSLLSCSLQRSKKEKQIRRKSFRKRRAKFSEDSIHREPPLLEPPILKMLPRTALKDLDSWADQQSLEVSDEFDEFSFETALFSSVNSAGLSSASFFVSVPSRSKKRPPPVIALPAIHPPL